MDWTKDWNMDSLIFKLLAMVASQDLDLELGTTQESPQQQLADLQGNKQVLEKDYTGQSI